MDRRQFVARLLATSAAGSLSVHAGVSHAQGDDAYPSRTVKVIVPYPAGGIVDVITRAATDRMALGASHRLIVDNKPGADARIGLEAAMRAAADGYTLTSATPILVINEWMQPEPTFRTSDFVGIGAIAAPGSVFVVPLGSPFRTLADFIDQARARPGQFNVPNPGVASSIHLGQELLFAQTGIRIQSVGYKGQPPSIADLIQGQLHFAMISQSLVMPHIRSGRLRALALNAEARSPSLPDVPTIGEAGYPDALVLTWHGLAAPARTPRPIIDWLSAELQKVIAMPETRANLATLDAPVMTMDAARFDKLMREESARWGKLIRERNIA